MSAKRAETSPWPRVRQLVWPHRWRVGLLSLMSFVGGLVEATFLVVVTRTALAVADGKEQTGLVGGVSVPIAGAIAIACGLVLVRLVLALSTVSVSTTLTTTVGLDVRSQLAKAYLDASWAIQQAQPSGRLQQLVMGSAGQAAGVISSFANVITAALNLTALVAVSIVVDPVATVVVVAALSSLGLVMAPIRRRIRLRARTAAAASMGLGTAVEELGSLGLEMQTFGVKDAFDQRLHELSQREARTRRRAIMLSGWLPVIYSSLAYLALVGGLAVSSLSGVRELSAIGAVMLVMLRSLAYGQQLQVGIGSLMQSLPFLEQADQAAEEYRRSRAAGGAARPADIGAVEFWDVNFGYQPNRPVLQDISFRIEPGEVIGLIGPSGAGKTTLVQLLLGLRQPTHGSVTIGSTDLSTVDRAWWTSRTSFVPQDPLLITGTVAENLRFFREIDDHSIQRAARMAHIDDTVRRLPQGYETHVGERGSKLSGGQRQRMSIARALAGAPSLIVLDEPTSSLDVESEALIRATISELHGRVTIVIVAHRLSTLDACDRLMVVDGGRISAFDSPERLRTDSDFYRRTLELSGLR